MESIPLAVIYEQTFDAIPNSSPVPDGTASYCTASRLAGLKTPHRAIDFKVLIATEMLQQPAYRLSCHQLENVYSCSYIVISTNALKYRIAEPIKGKPMRARYE
jgi:hypothetical protein